MQKMRNVTPVADRYLLPCIVYSCVFVSRIFKFHDAQRQTVHIQQQIRPAAFCLPVVHIVNRELVHHTEYIPGGISKIYKVDCICQTVLWCKLDAVHPPAVYFMERGKVRFRTGKADIVTKLLYFLFIQVGVLSMQKVVQVGADKNFTGIFTFNNFSEQICPSGIFQKRDKRSFKITFAETSVKVV